MRESGVRLGINLSKKKNKVAETPSVPQKEVLQQEPTSSEKVNQKETVDKAETKVAEQDIKQSAKVTFPVIYFTFMFGFSFNVLRIAFNFVSSFCWMSILLKVKYMTGKVE